MPPECQTTSGICLEEYELELCIAIAQPTTFSPEHCRNGPTRMILKPGEKPRSTCSHNISMISGPQNLLAFITIYFITLFHLIKNFKTQFYPCFW